MHTPGQVAQLVGINVETLRYYEGLGLLPAPERTAGGRRIYSEEALRLLRSIRTARGLGMRLSEIQAILPGRDGARLSPAKVRAALEGALARTRSELRTLNARRRNLEMLVEVVAGLRPDDDPRSELRDAWVHLEKEGVARPRPR